MNAPNIVQIVTKNVAAMPFPNLFVNWFDSESWWASVGMKLGTTGHPEKSVNVGVEEHFWW